MNKRINYILASTFLVLSIFACAKIVYAADPVGDDWFQILTNHVTGSNNTGDGGNYYYVGQSFNGAIQIKSNSGTSASNIWIDYDISEVSALGLTTGSFFPNWSGQTILGGRIKSTGYRTSGYSTGIGNFGSVNFTAISPTASNYGVSNLTSLVINVGTIGGTGESNISKSGLDLLDSAKNFDFYIWADTVKPYIKSNIGVGTFDVESALSFTLCDSKGGELADGGNCLSSGVGTGVDISTPPGYIRVNDGSGAQDYTAYDSYNCSGTWGTNRCDVLVDPPSPASLISDQRKWGYGSTYSVIVGGYRDKASSDQDQLGDPNGPNVVNERTWTFTTEGDTVKPRIVAESPTRAGSANSIDTNISVDILDKKDYSSNVSGIGLDPASCKIAISSNSFSSSTYQQGSSDLTVTPIDFGYRFTINPASDFAQNETVSISVYDCADLAGNIIVTDNYTFSTADLNPPYVDQKVPASDGYTSPSGKVSFHIRDEGVGVDLANTILYINGTYYTNTGGAGVVTSSGTRIAFANSLNFNGGNYFGDTTAVSGNSNDLLFSIDPQDDFSDEESVPVIIYSRDLVGNIMGADIYAFGVGNPPEDGSAYCGEKTTWDGIHCIGAAGYCSSSPSYNADTNGTLVIRPEINESNISIIQVDETSVLVTWFSNVKSSAWVIYGTSSIPNDVVSPSSSHQFHTSETSGESLYHSSLVTGLRSGTLYYFRPVIRSENIVVQGPELKMAPRFASYSEECVEKVSEKIVVQEKIIYRDREVPQVCPVYQIPDTKDSNANGDNEAKPSDENKKELKIGSVNANKDGVLVTGSYSPDIKLKLTLYLAKENVPMVLEVITDKNGNWGGKIVKSLEMGSYVIMVEDEDQKYQKPIVFYIPGSPTAIEKIISKANTEPVIFYSELLLSCLVLMSLGYFITIFKK